MRNYTAKDVDTYIKEAQPKLTELRSVIKSTVPKAEESISWGVPFYKLNGLLGGFAVFKTYVSFGLAFTLTDEEQALLAKQGYKTGKKTIQIRFDQPVPAVVKRMLKAQAKSNLTKKVIK